MKKRFDCEPVQLAVCNCTFFLDAVMQWMRVMAGHEEFV